MVTAGGPYENNYFADLRSKRQYDNRIIYWQYVYQIHHWLLTLCNVAIAPQIRSPRLLSPYWTVEYADIGRYWTRSKDSSGMKQQSSNSALLLRWRLDGYNVGQRGFNSVSKRLLEKNHNHFWHEKRHILIRYHTCVHMSLATVQFWDGTS